MVDSEAVCPTCGADSTRKDGRDRRGVIALAGRWYLRYWLSYADVAELLAKRGIRVDPSSVYAWVQEFAPLYEAAARAFRRTVGERWSVDETYVKVAGEWASVYRAIDERGQVIDVYVSEQRATADAAAFFRRAIEVTGVAPTEVTTDCAATYPPALAAGLPEALHETGKMLQQRIERDHQHLKGRLGPTRGFKTLSGARVLCAGHALLRNLRGGFYDLEPCVATSVLAVFSIRGRILALLPFDCQNTNPDGENGQDSGCCCGRCCPCRRSTRRPRCPGWRTSSAASWPPIAPAVAAAFAAWPGIAHEFSRCTTRNSVQMR
jgi:IS6 family transposase